MRRPLRITAIALVLSSLLAVVAALPAAADAPARAPLPAMDRTYTGVCSFPIHLTSDVQREIITAREGENGEVTYHASGTLKVTLTNMDTGYSLPMNISGPYRYTVHSDGSVSGWIMGRGAVAPGYPDITQGRLVVTYAPGWVLTAWHLSGRSESICAALDH